MKKPAQPASTGSGPLFERRYYIDIEKPALTAGQLMEAIQNNIAHYSPDLLAQFEKVKGQEQGLRKGDEFSIKILGPWNGSVRVTEVTEDCFEFLTLENHPRRAASSFRSSRWARTRCASKFTPGPAPATDSWPLPTTRWAWASRCSSKPGSCFARK
ncbi:hypothetical protein [Hymenobacter cellulosilyticus]|uniref:Uncharacterized protein n=1 Tax=Hymenobacter cellulosilyticus TaxID=2932248 RepID=A0A8T9QE16_9BACT|nr:hypothetical protein [Hymenobacter cellulosilyticus]UOQ74070.1 hypothetical protein MUN79_09345 [Hymenobacter cellulosilyticus]